MTKRLTLSATKDIIENAQLQEDALFYLSKDFGIGFDMISIFNDLLLRDEPVIVDDCRIGIIKDGEVNVTLNLIDYTVRAGTIIYLGAGSTVHFHNMSPNFKGEGLIFSDDFVKMSLYGRMPQRFSEGSSHFIIHADDAAVSIADGMMRLIWAIVNQSHFSNETIGGIVVALYNHINTLASANESSAARPRSHERRMFEQFIRLVNEHCRSERNVNFYADKMFVTPRYLSSIIKKTSGRTAKEWVDRAVVTAAKVQLAHTDKTVSIIADELCFSNDSFFCKYFRRLTDMTPLQYRESL